MSLNICTKLKLQQFHIKIFRYFTKSMQGIQNIIYSYLIFCLHIKFGKLIVRIK